jgi:hypothetical protein
MAKKPPVVLPKVTPLTERPDQDKVEYLRKKGWIPIIGGDDALSWIPNAACTSPLPTGPAVREAVVLTLREAEAEWLRIFGWEEMQPPGSLSIWADPLWPEWGCTQDEAVRLQKTRSG